MQDFPAALTSFVGRAGAVGEVAGLLEQSRLVTVTRPGGSGKTRLAPEVARRVAGRFADGVWLAELAPVRDPGQVSLAVLAALGAREQAGMDAADPLARVLAIRPLPWPRPARAAWMADPWKLIWQLVAALPRTVAGYARPSRGAMTARASASVARACRK